MNNERTGRTAGMSDTEYLLVNEHGEMLTRCRNAAEAAELLTICLDNIPPGHSIPGIYVRQGSQFFPLIESADPSAFCA